ncbi:hypothetical protein UWK_00712 [Desulfocapsa sulfexigens DSM 10523]|uniref:Uncharacterized protein n=1 Tax=Desulfocapsa sulfexigens (strain DSM 10523 / SB164P1) TaxID=1167006 RepID=M1PC05_DESSD|nr:hypothetical protein [Desulfocapsa sulfexigens]AGF77290.1 hypothetical protein UWK_00712 [Desulfocapsa sulfexigens DSM 10523]
MMNRIFELITWIFDPLHHFYEHEKVHRKISFVLVLIFISGLLIIELKRRQLLPAELAPIIPKNHFYAISWAFTMILVLEVISLIFTLPCSFSRSVGKQFEILSLILIRNAFKELSYFQEPVTFIGNEESILHILSNGFGAFLIFALLSVYYKLQKDSYNERDHIDNIFNFVAAKKGVALVLLISFAGMGAHSFYLTTVGIEHTDFFHGFYTLLIITDILVVLIAQCFHPAFYTIFRNSGFALSTLIIRLALVAPVYFDVLLGVAAIILAILLTVISGRMFPGHEYSEMKN